MEEEYIEVKEEGDLQVDNEVELNTEEEFYYEEVIL